MEDKKKSSLSVASLVLGIISVLTTLFWFITLPTGILAIIFGVKGIRRVGSKLAKAGFILGIIGLSIFALIYISIILIILLSTI